MNDQTLDPEDPYGFGSFRGKVAVITGGTQGLGLATAQLLKARGAEGILIVGRDVDKGQAAAESLDGDGCRTVFVAADLATEAGIQSIIDETDAEFGTVDVFVNSAAATWRGTVWNTTGEMWDQMLALNMKTPALLITGFAKIMKRESVQGAMVVIGSIAHHGGIAELFPYVASKHGLEAVVKHAANSLRAERIRVNLLNPGWMDTPAEDATQKRFHGASDDWLAEAEARQPFGRLLKPQEVARGICFLASDESGMMTGSSVDFDQTIAGQGPAAQLEVVPENNDWTDG